MARAAHPEDIIAELTSRVERIFHEVGTPLPLEEGESARSFTENHVLWNSEGGETLQQIFSDYTEAGDESVAITISPSGGLEASRSIGVSATGHTSFSQPSEQEDFSTKKERKKRYVRTYE